MSNAKFSYLTPSYEAIAELLASKLQEDRLAKEGAISIGQDFITHKKKEIEQELSKNLEESLKIFQLAGSLLKEELRMLPPTNPLAEALQIALERLHLLQDLDSLGNRIDLVSAQTVQEFLGLSHDSVLSLYQIGERFFLEKEYEKSYAIFRLVLQLNPTISDYWTALAFTQEKKELRQEALDSLAFAILLNPEDPRPRYLTGKLCVELGQIKDAKTELEALEHLFLINRSPALASATEELRILIAHFRG